MADSNNSDGADANPEDTKESGLDQSFVGKFVTGLLSNTPLSKWFGGTSQVRKREDNSDDDEDVSYILQPPVKRAKLPRDSTAHDASNNINTRAFTSKFPEPVAGPSGLFFDKPQKGLKLSGSFSTRASGEENESGSEDSTSGYSSTSRILKKDMQDGGNQTQQLEDCIPLPRSLFNSSKLDESGSRSLFSGRNLQLNTSLSTRRPNFNPSSYETPAPSQPTGESSTSTRTPKALLKDRKIIDSPFYNGMTTYGGASAYERRCVRPESSLKPGAIVSRNAVQIKPVNQKIAQENVQLSKTARRILSTLEQYTTPLAASGVDSTKKPEGLNSRKSGLLTNYIGATPYVIRERKRPSNTELLVPTIPDLLRMKQKEQLQKSTESVRHVATSAKNPAAVSSVSQYKLRSEEDSKDDKKSSKQQQNTGKIKSGSVASQMRKRNATQPQDEAVVPVNLPQVPLPITTLPTFDLGATLLKNDTKTVPKTKPDSTSSSTQPEKTTEKKDNAKRIHIIENKKLNMYIFSRPNVVAENFKSVPALKTFKFCEPLKKQGGNQEKTETKSGGTEHKATKLKNNGETGTIRLNKEGASFDSLTVLKPSSGGKWECQTCLVWNEPSKNTCVACQEPKPVSQSSSMQLPAAATEAQKQTNHFGDKKLFSGTLNNNLGENLLSKDCNKTKKNAESSEKPVINPFKTTFAADTWECPTCMIRNRQESAKCVACETCKPAPKQLPLLAPKLATNTPVQSQFQSLSQSQSQQWKCETCLIRNSQESLKCAACEMPRFDKSATPAPSFGSTFKLNATQEWECEVCMVRNKQATTTCVCCGTHKPGTSAAVTEPVAVDAPQVALFNFGVTKPSEQFKFGIPPAQNAEKTVELQLKATVSSVPFQFGIPAAPAKTEERKEDVTEAPAAKTTVPPPLSDVFKTPVVSTPTTGFTFGMPPKYSAPEPAKSSDQAAVTSTASSDKIGAGGFKFGFGNAAVVNKKAEETLPKIASKPSELFTGFVSQQNTVAPPPPVSSATVNTPIFGVKQVNGDLGKTPEMSTSGATIAATAATGTKVSAAASTPPMFKFVASQPFDSAKPPTTQNNLFSASPAPSTNQVVAMKRTNADSQPATGSQFNNGFGSAPKIAAFASPTTTNMFGANSKPFSFATTTAAPSIPPPPQQQVSFAFGQHANAQPPANTSNPNLFSFGSAAAAAPQAAVNAENLTRAPVASQSGSGGFNFTTTSLPSTGFNFGQSSNLFGGVGSVDQTKNGTVTATSPATFSFGASAAATENGGGGHKNIFSFGAVSATPTPPMAKSGFGGMMATPVQTGSTGGTFNFGPAAGHPVPPAVGDFNFPGATPSFNYTDGASTGGGATQQRKFRKAVRRATPR